ncbi:RHS repeat-associated core domain-containing protein [Pseudomonas syringae]|uniref:RHS repeat-associated core domain-containing protein n=1 Tax=Pseudomonas syringae TaxID=317 RepID=UPI001F2E1298|nr:RHS repeat-associated core domain-containing protein [Pseudomonas syringae]MCF5706937.1 RHS repeat-associated core domain-containing protein [Pseudomonas syringae]
MNELCWYKYDALDRIASLTLPARAAVQRFYNRQYLVTEVAGEEQRVFVRAGDTPVLQRRVVNGQSLIAQCAADQQKSILHVSCAGQKIAVRYTPYGYREDLTAVPGLPGFNGEPVEPVTGHYLLGNGVRAYNPVLMRFNNPDGLSPFGKGGLNAYSYCAGDPVNRSDPTGHMFKVRPVWPGNVIRERTSNTVKTAPYKPEQSAALNTGPKRVFRRPQANLEDMPSHVKETIAGALPGNDAANMARVSTHYESVVMAASARQYKTLNIADLPFQPWLKKLDDIYFGEVRGIAPMFLKRSGIPFSYVQANLIRETRVTFEPRRVLSWRLPVRFVEYAPTPETAESRLMAMQLQAMNGGGF